MPRFGWTREDFYLVAVRAYSLYVQGHYREAGIIFEGLLAVDPDDRYCREALAAVCLALAQPQRAIEELNVLIEREPADLELRSRRCEAHLDLGNFSAALEDYEFVRALLPERVLRRVRLRFETAGARARRATSVQESR